MKCRLILLVLGLSCAVAFAQDGQPKKAPSDDDYIFARYDLRSLYLYSKVDYAQSLGPENSQSGGVLQFEDEESDFEELIQFIEKNVATDTWDDTDARIEQTETEFRIYQTRAIHRKLRELWTYLEHLASPRIHVFVQSIEVPEELAVNAGDRLSKDQRAQLKALQDAGKAQCIWSQRAKGRDGAQLVARGVSQQMIVGGYDYQEVTLTQSLAPLVECLTDGVEVELGLTMAHSKMRFDLWVAQLKTQSIENRTVGPNLLQCPSYKKRELHARFYGRPGDAVVLSSVSGPKKMKTLVLAEISDLKALKAPKKLAMIRRYSFRSICPRSFRRILPKRPEPPTGGGVLNFEEEEERSDRDLANELFEQLQDKFPESEGKLWQLGDTLFVTGPETFQKKVKAVIDLGIPPLRQSLTYELQHVLLKPQDAPRKERLSKKELRDLLGKATSKKRYSLQGLLGNKAVLRDYHATRYLSNVVSYQRMDKKLAPVLVPETNEVNTGLFLECVGAKSASKKGWTVRVKISQANMGPMTELKLGAVKIQLPQVSQLRRVNEDCFFQSGDEAQIIYQAGRNGVAELFILSSKLIGQ